MLIDTSAKKEYDLEEGAPLEKVARTKWKGAGIEWRGEPVL